MGGLERLSSKSREASFPAADQKNVPGGAEGNPLMF